MTNPTGDALKASAAQVRVKPLEWSANEARSALRDLYSVAQLSEHVCTTHKNGTAFAGWKTTINEAKAAAQADYEARILAALSAVEQAPQPFAWYWFDQHGCLYITGDDRKPDIPQDAKPLYEHPADLSVEQASQSPSPETHVTVVTVEFCQKVIAEQNRIIGELQAELDKGKTP